MYCFWCTLWERESPDRGDCLYIRLSPALCFLLKHCPHISNYVLAVYIYIIPLEKKLTLPYKFAAKLIIKVFYYLAINFSFTTCASDGTWRFDISSWSGFIDRWAIVLLQLYLSLIFGQEERILLEGIIAELKQFPENMHFLYCSSTGKN